MSVSPAEAFLASRDPSAFLANDPVSAFLDAGPKPPPPPRIDDDPNFKRVAIGIAAAIVVLRVLMKAGLAGESPSSDAEIREAADRVYRRILPAWAQVAIPAIAQAYRLGVTEDVTYDELERMAVDYVAELGDYVHSTSIDALTEGFNSQVNANWSERLAWTRASAAYGLDSSQMRAYVSGLIKPSTLEGGTGYVTEAVPAASRAAVDRAFILRADRLGTNEAFKATQMGRNLVWMQMSLTGALPQGCRKRWITAEDERVCAICGYLDMAEVALASRFTTPGGEKFYAPGVHPNCRCTLDLVRPDVELEEGITKAAPGDPYDRDSQGQFARRESRFWDDDEQEDDEDAVANRTAVNDADLDLDGSLDLDGTLDLDQDLDLSEGRSRSKVLIYDDRAALDLRAELELADELDLRDELDLSEDAELETEEELEAVAEQEAVADEDAVADEAAEADADLNQELHDDSTVFLPAGSWNYLLTKGSKPMEHMDLDGDDDVFSVDDIVTFERDEEGRSQINGSVSRDNVATADSILIDPSFHAELDRWWANAGKGIQEQRRKARQAADFQANLSDYERFGTAYDEDSGDMSYYRKALANESKANLMHVLKRINEADPSGGTSGLIHHQDPGIGSWSANELADALLGAAAKETDEIYDNGGVRRNPAPAIDELSRLAHGKGVDNIALFDVEQLLDAGAAEREQQVSGDNEEIRMRIPTFFVLDSWASRSGADASGAIAHPVGYYQVNSVETVAPKLFGHGISPDVKPGERREDYSEGDFPISAIRLVRLTAVGAMPAAQK